MSNQRISRRRFLQTSSMAATAVAGSQFGRRALWAAETAASTPLGEFSYGDVLMASDLHEAQLHNTQSVLMDLSDDSLLKPLRAMSGMPAPGEEMGGWYQYVPEFD